MSDRMFCVAHHHPQHRVLLWVVAVLLVGVMVVCLWGGSPVGVQAMSAVQDEKDGLVELFRLIDETPCKHNLEGHCVPGTVEIPPWLLQSFAFQKRLQMDLPLNQAMWPGTHNSYNARSGGGTYGLEDNLLRKLLLDIGVQEDDIVIAQQEYAMTDQLRMGVRHIMLDAQWFAGKVRLCHAGNEFKWYDQIVDFFEKILHRKFNYSSEQLGCSPFDMPWSEGVQELADWIKAEENLQEILFVELNCQQNWDWGHKDEVMDPLIQMFGDLIFTPAELKNMTGGSSWPSMRTLLSLNKRVILGGDSGYATYGGEWVHPTPFQPNYPANDANNFFPLPMCDPHMNGNQYITDYSGESVVYGPFYNGPRDMGLIVPSTLQHMLPCNVGSPKMDQVSPGLLANMIWTWAPGQPANPVNSTDNCVALSRTDGRWYTISCDDSNLFACQSTQNPDQWQALPGTLSGEGIGRDVPACPIGTTFSVPRVPFHSYLLHQSLLAMSITWGDYVIMDVSP